MLCTPLGFTLLIIIPLILFTAAVTILIFNLYIDFTIEPKYENLFRKENGFLESKIGNRLFSIIIIIFTITLIIRPIVKELFQCLGAK